MNPAWQKCSKGGVVLPVGGGRGWRAANGGVWCDLWDGSRQPALTDPPSPSVPTEAQQIERRLLMMSQRRSRPLTFVVYAKRQESRVISCLDFHILFSDVHTHSSAGFLSCQDFSMWRASVLLMPCDGFLPLARRAQSTLLLRELQRPVIAPNIRKRSVFWVEVYIYAGVMPGGCGAITLAVQESALLLCIGDHLGESFCFCCLKGWMH